jgi:hypothetical protein
VALELAPAVGVDWESVVGGKVVIEQSEEAEQLVGHGVFTRRR